MLPPGLEPDPAGYEPDALPRELQELKEKALEVSLAGPFMFFLGVCED